MGTLTKDIPNDLIALWLWHDGQSPTYMGDFHPITNEMFMPIAEALETMDILNEYVESGDVSSSNWCGDWLPFTENGGGNYMCVSLTTGEVVYFDKYAVSTGKRYSSFSEWLEKVIDGYEKL